MQSSKHAPLQGSAKPPRLRSACTACRRVKLRCSGERTGCSRCVRLGLACEYAVSLVGRASKKRQEPTQAARRRVALLSQEPTPRNNQSVALDSDIPGLGFLDDQVICGDVTNDSVWDTFFDLSAHPVLPPGETPSTSDKFTASGPDTSPDLVQHVTLGTAETDAPRHMTAEVEVTTVQVDSFQSTSDPWPVRTVEEQSFAGSSASYQEITLCAHDDSPHSSHMMALGRIISSLDNNVVDKAITIDKVMQISKGFIDQVTSFMNMEFDRTCRSCRTLVATIVELILELYENATSLATRPPGHINKYPKLSFGAFTIDPAGYPALYQQVIHTELRRLAPIINILRSGCGAPVGSSRHARHQETFSEMDQRIQKMTGLSTQT